MIWTRSTLEKRRHDRILRKCAAKMRFRTAIKCLQGWHTYVARENKQRRIVAAALHRLKNRIVIAAYTSWRDTTARCKRNRRVLAKHLDAAARKRLRVHMLGWAALFAVGAKVRSQLKRIWRLKRARYIRLYFQDWMAKVATQCTVCHRTSRPLYRKQPPKLKSVKDWSRREGGWDRMLNNNKADIPDYLKSLPPLKSPPPSNLKKKLLGRPSPEQMVARRNVGQLKRIIDRAGKLQSMTSAARLELETSNRVLEGFVQDLVASDVLSPEVQKELLEMEVNGNESLHDVGNEITTLDRARASSPTFVNPTTGDGAAARTSVVGGRGSGKQGKKGRVEVGSNEDILVSDPSRPVVLPQPRAFRRINKKDRKSRRGTPGHLVGGGGKSAVDLL